MVISSLWFAEYLNKPGCILSPKMFSVIARRGAIDWWDGNRKHFRSFKRLSRSLVGERNIKTDDFENLIQRLRNRDKEFLRLYFRDGIFLEEIGKLYRMTREGVRVAIEKAIERIRRLDGYYAILGAGDSHD